MKTPVRAAAPLPAAPLLAIPLLAIPLLAILLVTACSVGPDHPPEARALINAPAAQGALPGAANANLTPDPVPGRWWQLYRDPALNRLIAEARAANTSLRVAEANLRQAQAQTEAARASGQPTVAANFGYAYDQVSAESYLVNTPVPPMQLYDSGISASYQLDLFGQIRRATQAAQASGEAAAATRDAVAITVVADTALAYAQACAANQALAVARRQVATAGQIAAITRRLQADGRAIPLDVLRTAAQRDVVAAALPAYRAAHDAALARLAVLTGRVRPDFPADVVNCASPPRLLTPIPVGDGAALLRRRPDLRAAERSLAAATYRIGVVTAELYPQISFGTQVGSIGTIGTFLAPETNLWGFGPTISWNLNHAVTRAKIKAAGAAQQAALARFDGAVLSALGETATAISAYDHDLERAQVLTKVETETAAAERTAQTLYRAGETDIEPTLQTEVSHEQAQAALVAMQGQLSMDQIRLFLALGGGW